MPTCLHCGERNADNEPRCKKCGVAFGSQLRAQAGKERYRRGNFLRVGAWIVALVVLAIAAPPVYRSADGYYLRFHLESVTANAMDKCGGPITDKTPSYEQDQINDCVAKSEELAKAKADLAAYTNSEKH